MHPLLVSELQSILQDCLPGQIISDSLVKDWSLNKWKLNEETAGLLGFQVNPNEFVQNLFLHGPGVAEKFSSNSFAKKIAKKKEDKWAWSMDTEKLTKLSDFLLSKDNSQSSQKLAILMSHRTSYGNIKKSLTLGTIIRKGTKDTPEYFLCLLPSCDTVRLQKKRRFIFCTLDVKSPDTGITKASHVIEDEGKIVELLYTPKSYNCVTLQFEPDPETKRVMATEDQSGNLGYIFNSDNHQYKWIAQLKPDHAQRAAELFARDLSRVGLTESEWLRLMSR